MYEVAQDMVSQSRCIRKLLSNCATQLLSRCLQALGEMDLLHQFLISDTFMFLFEIRVCSLIVLLSGMLGFEAIKPILLAMVQKVSGDVCCNLIIKIYALALSATTAAPAAELFSKELAEIFLKALICSNFAFM